MKVVCQKLIVYLIEFFGTKCKRQKNVVVNGVLLIFWSKLTGLRVKIFFYSKISKIFKLLAQFLAAFILRVKEFLNFLPKLII